MEVERGVCRLRQAGIVVFRMHGRGEDGERGMEEQEAPGGPFILVPSHAEGGILTEASRWFGSEVKVFA